MRRQPSARALYRRWYGAAGPWAGFFRAVPLVALARGVVAPPRDDIRRDAPSWERGTRRNASGIGRCATSVAVPGDGDLAAELAGAGRAEGWLGRRDVLLLLDLPGATSVTVAVRLAPHAVRPVLLLLRWPEPGALLPADDVLAALLDRVPPLPSAAWAQYAFVLERERATAATPADLAVRFDNRYELGAMDLPSAERLREGGVLAVVACRQAPAPPAPDLTGYLVALEAATLPVRRLVLSAES